MATIDSILTAWMEQSRSLFISNYNSSGRRASGRTEKETVVNKIDDKHQQILTTPYIGAVVNGRKPTSGGGNGSVRRSIRQWIDYKGITPQGNISKDTLAFLIARHIHNFGIHVPNQYNDGNLIRNTFTQPRIDQLLKDLGLNYINEIKSDIQTTWQR